MSGLTEREVIDRHLQCLGEARQACVYLGKNIDPDQAAPRYRHYDNLRAALDALEGSCRQMAYFRDDARWLRLGTVYSRARLAMQQRLFRADWKWFMDLTALFEKGQRSVDEIRNTRTGKLGAILPQRPSDWLIMPDR